MSFTADRRGDKNSRREVSKCFQNGKRINLFFIIIDELLGFIFLIVAVLL